MAKRRMMSLDIVDTDLFLTMPASTQNLYFHYLARADDDGFIDSPKKIMNFVKCSDDDLKILIMKSFIIPFETGICVIKHWKMHNYIRSDRYKETVYLEEKSQLTEGKNGIYELGIATGIPNGTPGKVSIGQYNSNSYNKTMEEIVEENFGRALSSFEYEEIEELKNVHGEELFKEAIRITTLNNIKNIPYAKKILSTWKIQGIKSIEDIKFKEQLKQNEESPKLFDYNWLEDSND